jgi:hydrogenase-4 component C
MVPSFSEVVLAILQALLLLAAAPMLSGLSRVLRAKMHTRRGPGMLQDYRDLLKLMKRQDIRPPASGAIFQIMPVVLMAIMLLIAMGTPVITRYAPISAIGDLVTTIYLFATARFFFALSGIDSGSSFAGIGGSRELTLGILVEPMMLLALFVAALLAGSTNLGAIGNAVVTGQMHSMTATLMAALAFGFAAYIELGKLPYDMAEAEQELQEGPLTEYSGPSLALIKWSMALKQTVIVAWFIGVFLPFGSPVELSLPGVLLGIPIFAMKTVAIFLVVGIVENSVARARFRLTPQHSWLGMGVAALALVFYLVGL